MFNTLLNDNVLLIIRIKCVTRIIRNTRIKQLRFYVSKHIYVTGELQIWGNFKFPQWKLEFDFPLVKIPIRVCTGGI